MGYDLDKEIESFLKMTKLDQFKSTLLTQGINTAVEASKKGDRGEEAKYFEFTLQTVDELGCYDKKNRAKFAKALRVFIRDHGNRLEDTIMSSMDARTQKKYFGGALKHIADLMYEKKDQRAANALKTLADDVSGSDFFNRYDVAALTKMAKEILDKRVAGKSDAPRVNLDMVKAMKWEPFLKIYGVSTNKSLQDAFAGLAKQLVVEGHSSLKPLGSAKDIFKVLKSDSTTGRFKTPQHLLGAVTDGMLKKGKVTKPINEKDAKGLVAT